MVVDDNVDFCTIVSLILKRKGYAVASAKDGPKAIEMAKENAFDVIFMDIRLPLMNGVEVCRRIKGIRPQAVAVMMTAYAAHDLVQEALQHGAYRVIYKPVDMDEVIELVEEIVKTKQRG